MAHNMLVTKWCFKALRNQNLQLFRGDSKKESTSVVLQQQLALVNLWIKGWHVLFLEAYRWTDNGRDGGRREWRDMQIWFENICCDRSQIFLNIFPVSLQQFPFNSLSVLSLPLLWIPAASYIPINLHNTVHIISLISFCFASFFFLAPSLTYFYCVFCSPPPPSIPLFSDSLFLLLPS